MVVPALESLTPELLSSRGAGAAAGFRAACCLLAALTAGLAVFTGRAGNGFSGIVDLKGERGNVRELCDFGDKTVLG